MYISSIIVTFFCICESREIFGDKFDECYDRNFYSKLETPSWFQFLSPSIFDHVPPTIKFNERNQRRIALPKILSSQLHWGSTKRISDIANTHFVINQTGLTIINETEHNYSKFSIISSYDQHEESSSLEDNQNVIFHSEYMKINHLPNIIELDNKILLAKNQKLFRQKFGVRTYPWYIPTFVLPDEYEKFVATCRKMNNKIWALKPSNSSRCRGIKFINDCSATINITETNVVQKYIHNPFTLWNKKIEFRKYVILTSIDPLRIYIHNDNLIKISRRNYTINEDNISDMCIHTPGLSTCRTEELDFGQNTEVINGAVEKICNHVNGLSYCKKMNNNSILSLVYSSDDIYSELANAGFQRLKFEEDIEEAIIKTIVSAYSSLLKGIYETQMNSYNSYNLIAFDFFVDKNLKLWLNEVNRRPGHGLHTLESIIDTIAGSLTLTGHNLPSSLSDEAKKLILDAFQSNHPSIKLEDPTFDRRMYKFDLTEQDLLKQIKIDKLLSIHANPKIIHETILQNLTSSEVRKLIIAEDEYNRIPSSFRRSFPSSNMDKYSKYIEPKTYNHLLFNAWEKKFGQGNRKHGIEILKNLAKKKFHLQ